MITSRRLAVVALFAAVCAVATSYAGAAGPTPRPMPNHHQMEALFVIDHNGRSPRSDAELRPYSEPFEKIVASCKISVDTLTNVTIFLSDMASQVGARNVTSLQMLRSIARRITWQAPRQYCWNIYDLAEGHLEAGDP